MSDKKKFGERTLTRVGKTEDGAFYTEYTNRRGLLFFVNNSDTFISAVGDRQHCYHNYGCYNPKKQVFVSNPRYEKALKNLYLRARILHFNSVEDMKQSREKCSIGEWYSECNTCLRDEAGGEEVLVEPPGNVRTWLGVLPLVPIGDKCKAERIPGTPIVPDIFQGKNKH